MKKNPIWRKWAWVNFSLRTHMFKCKMNFMNDPAYKAEMWRCNSCETCIDSQSHILYCPAYKELREGKSLTSDEDIVNYFREVMIIRTKLDLNKWGMSWSMWLQFASLPRYTAGVQDMQRGKHIMFCLPVYDSDWISRVIWACFRLNCF